ncbi:hypothetical protein LOAG_10837, partial [Loa loa]
KDSKLAYQKLEFKSSNNLVAMNHQVVKENSDNTRRYHLEQEKTSLPTDTCKSSTVQITESTDISRNSNQFSPCTEKIQKPPISIIAVQITEPKSNRRTICTNENETDRSNKSEIKIELSDSDV